MTSFHLPPAPRPYQPPAFVRHLVQRFRPENWLQNAIHHPAVPTSPDTEHAGMDWNAIAGNAIATVAGGLLIGLASGVLYLAWQVPRSQDQILYNQIEMKRSLDNITQRMERLELNDRRQDADIIRQQHTP
mgnify:FL=1